ncbi:hypothetical protein ACWCP6_27520 [Streptomyces sp. NPDC002004]
MAAAIVLLAAAVLLHFATPHHSAATPLAASAMTAAVEAEPRKAHVLTHAHTGSEHHAETAEAVARLPRGAQTLTERPALDEATDDCAAASAGSGPAQPRTARCACNPSAGATPTPTNLQTFRC